MNGSVPYRVCHLSELGTGSALGVDPEHCGRDTVFVVKKGERVFAYRDACPHYEGATTLPWRKDAYLDSTAEFIVCAAHGAEFEVETGLCVRGPCKGDVLTSVPLSIASDGIIVIEC